MEEKIVTLATFYDAGLAHISLGRLESEGIPCFLADGNISTINPLYNQAVGGIKLKIFERDVERCKEILGEEVTLISQPGAQGTSTDHCACPACNSNDVGYGLATRNRFNLFTTVISLLLLVFPFHNKKAWHCYNCGEEFSKV